MKGWVIRREKGSLQIRSVAAVAADATRVVWEGREGWSVTPVA